MIHRAPSIYTLKIPVLTAFSRIFLLILPSFGLSTSKAQDIFSGYEHLLTPPLHYTVYKLPGKIEIDGKMIEKAWERAPWTEYYQDIEGDKKPKPTLKTRCKMLWDADHLYIVAELEEPHVWGKLDKHDQIVFHDNDFEVFIDPDNDTHHYFELEFNALNTVFDLYLTKPYRNRGQLHKEWNAANLKSAVFVEGTLNNPADKDKKWTVEMAIPFSSLQMNDYKAPKPANGATWRINFSRVQWDTEVKDGDYVKMVDPVTNKRLPEHNWVWSPQGVINMHFPERWGYLRFSDQQPGKQQATFVLPQDESFKKYLWLVYYKQKAFAREQRKYAIQLSEIGLPESITEKGETIKLELSASDRAFKAIITSPETGKRWQIDEDGKVEGL